MLRLTPPRSGKRQRKKQMNEKTFDFHSHILPNVDDGSKSLKESIAMLRMEAEQGIAHVVATPHFYANYDSPERFLRRRARAEAALRQEMAGWEGLPEVSLGAEVYFFSGISDSEVLSQLTIAKKRCILIEMPQSPWSESMYRELEGIYVKQNLTPIIAHVDRYIGPFRTHGIPERLADLPVIVQANADFFLERSTSRMAMKLLREGRIQLLGSDCHNLTSRAPNLGDALKRIEKKLGRGAIDAVNAAAWEILGRNEESKTKSAGILF